jgi:hypothetical protein
MHWGTRIQIIKNTMTKKSEKTKNNASILSNSVNLTNFGFIIDKNGVLKKKRYV